MADTNHATLAGSLWPAHSQRLLRNVVIVIAGSLLLTLAAKIKVPFWPVPMTMQPLVVVGLGLALGGRLALATVMLYLAQGAMGLPVFTGTPEKGLGLAYMVGPTGGYLLGFALAALVVGWLADKGWSKGYLLSLAAALIGVALIYLPGATWLGTLIGFDRALQFGVLPFLLKDIVGAAIAGLAIPSLWQLVRR